MSVQHEWHQTKTWFHNSTPMLVREQTEWLRTQGWDVAEIHYDRYVVHVCSRTVPNKPTGVLTQMAAWLREDGFLAEVIRDTDEGGFAWAELGGIAASIDIVTDDDKGSWFAHVTAANSDKQIIEHKPSATQLHSIVLSLLQTESTTP
jgi:hypothetical protein